MRHIALRTGLVLGLLIASATWAMADAKVEEQEVARATEYNMSVISAQGAHLACVSHKGSRVAVLIDGVAGPKLDQVDMASGAPPTNGYTSLEPRTRVIVFSPDGVHCAYCGQQGNEMVVVVDGKELQRLPYKLNMFSGCPLQFSPGGKHIFYAYDDSTSHTTFVIDGKPCPFTPSALPPTFKGIEFSPDELHYAFLTANPDKPDVKVLILDGQVLGAVGEDPQFTPDSKAIITTLRQQGVAAMMINGKLAAKAPGLVKICLAPVGRFIIPIVVEANPATGGTTMYLIANGKKIEDSVARKIDRVIFSPDGKHYAAHCIGPQDTQQWVVIDGNKGDPYKQIDPADMKYSPDSSKMVYVAQNNGVSVVVVNSEESDAFDLMADKPKFSATGSHLVYVTSQNNDPNTSVVFDGKAVKRRFGGLPVLSPDGARCAFVYGGPNGVGPLVVDGVDQKVTLAKQYAFNADGKHLECIGKRDQDPDFGLFVDGTPVYTRPCIFFPTFTPDGQHLFWLGVEPPAADGGGSFVVYCDGKAVTKLDNKNGSIIRGDGAWSMQPDGTLVIVGNQGESIKRMRITAPADTSIATMLAAGDGAGKK